MHRRPLDSREAGALNRELVFSLLRATPVVSRAGLARETGLSKATVSQIVDQLSRDGLVQVVGPGRTAKGRRPTLLRLEPRARFVIGVQVEDTYCRALLADLHGQTLRTVSTAVRALTPYEALDAASDLIATLRAECPPGKLLGIGLGTPGLVDSRRGVIRSAANLGWHEVPAGSYVAERFGVPAVVINRAKAAAVGEAWWGAGRGADSLISLFISVGISAGIVLGGELYRGVSMSEGEVGHHTVLADGPLCPCGNRGCLQMVASGPAILAQVRERLRAEPASRTGPLADAPLDRLVLDMVAEAAAAGNSAVHAVLDDVAQHLGLVAANLVDTLDPAMLIFGGPVIRALPMLVPRVEAVVRRRAVWVPAPSVRVVATQLGEDAVATGAAAFLLSHISVVETAGRASIGDVAEPASLAPRYSVQAAPPSVPALALAEEGSP